LAILRSEKKSFSKTAGQETNIPFSNYNFYLGRGHISWCVFHACPRKLKKEERIRGVPSLQPWIFASPRPILHHRDKIDFVQDAARIESDFDVLLQTALPLKYVRAPWPLACGAAARVAIRVSNVLRTDTVIAAELEAREESCGE
jgi:hypothetical protein